MGRYPEVHASRATILSVPTEGLPLGAAAQVPGRPVLPQAAQGALATSPLELPPPMPLSPEPHVTRTWEVAAPLSSPSRLPPLPPNPLHITRTLPLCRPWLKGWLSTDPPPDPEQDTGPA